jgi:hypothetical protein
MIVIVHGNEEIFTFTTAKEANDHIANTCEDYLKRASENEAVAPYLIIHSVQHNQTTKLRYDRALELINL